MTPTSRQIYGHLQSTLESGKMMKMTELELRMGVPKRGLQSTDGNPGIFQLAQREIFDETHIFLVSLTGPNGGAMLSRDLEKMRYSCNQRAKHLWSDKKAVDQMQEIIYRVETKAQIPAFETK